MAYIGKSIESGTFSVLDTSGNTYNGSNTAFNLGTQVGSVAQLLVSHDGVIQKPGTDYTLSSGGAAITFTTAPASGASIFIVEISGAVGGPLDSDLNGTELILDADGDTSITADTDDQIDIKIAGADDFSFTANTFTAAAGSSISSPDYSGGAVFNEGSADVDFRVEGNGDANLFFVDGGNDNIGISNAAPDTDAKFHISQGGYRGAGTDKHALLVGADIGDASSMTNSNRKLGSIVAPHYTNAEEPITIARLDSDNGSSELRIGGTAETNSTEKIVFRTATDDADKSTGSDRMVIFADGDVSIGATANEARLDVRGSANAVSIQAHNTATSGIGTTVLVAQCDQDTSNSSYLLQQCRNGGGLVFKILDSGNVQNTNNSYGSTSDERIKQDISDASSQWEDIKALKIRKFKKKKDVNRDGADNTPYHLGVVAQELEASGMNGLVEEGKPQKEDVALHSDFGSIDSEGNFTEGQKVKEVKYSVLYMKSVKALQEAMAKIESLEARVTTLEG